VTEFVPDCIQHPHLIRLYRYWRGLSADGSVPLRAAIDAVALRDLLPSLYLLDAGATPDDLRYRLAGSRIVQAFGFEPGGLSRGEIRTRHVKPAAFADFDQTSRETHDIVARRQISYTHDHMTSYDRRYLAYARLNLPISEDGRHISGVFGGIVSSRDGGDFWRDFHDFHVEVPLAEIGIAAAAD